METTGKGEDDRQDIGQLLEQVDSMKKGRRKGRGGIGTGVDSNRSELKWNCQRQRKNGSGKEERQLRNILIKEERRRD